MAKISDDYAYYIKGRFLFLVEKDKNGEYDSPSTSGKMRFEFAAIPYFLDAVNGTSIDESSTPIDESHFIDMDRHLVLACVCYVKGKILLDAGDAKGHDYYMMMFKQKVGENQNARNHGVRRIASGQFSIK